MGEEPVELVLWRDQLEQLSHDDLVSFAMSTQTALLDYRELVLEYQRLIETYKDSLRKVRGML